MGACLSVRAGAAVAAAPAPSDAAKSVTTTKAPTSPDPPADKPKAAADIVTARKARDGAKRVAIAANAIARVADVKLEAYPKSDTVFALLERAVSSSLLFDALSAPERAALLHSMRPITIAAGAAIITQGDTKADSFYILEKGAAVATIAAPAAAAEEGGADAAVAAAPAPAGAPPTSQPTVVKTYGPGSAFGDLALLYSASRAATVTATSPCKLWAMDRGVYGAVRRAQAAAAAARRAALVGAVPLLAPLAPDRRAIVAAALERVEFADGEVVFSAGDAGDALYLVDEGAVVLSAPPAGGGGGGGSGARAPPPPPPAAAPAPGTGGAPPPADAPSSTVLARLGPGAYFGERALVRAEPRAASAVADSYTVLWRLPRPAFDALLGPAALIWAAEALRRSPALASLSPAQVTAVAGAMSRVVVPPGGLVFSAGDPGDAFYVVDEGGVDLLAPAPPPPPPPAAAPPGADGAAAAAPPPPTPTLLARLGRGGVFGERALLDRAPRAAAAVAGAGHATTALLRLGAADFEALLGPLPSLRTVWRAEALGRVPILAGLDAGARGALAAALIPRTVPAGGAAVTAGEAGDEFFLVESGSLSITGPDGSPLGSVGPGGYFGELALLRGAPRAATVTATGGPASLLALPRAGFEALLGPAKARLTAAAGGYARAGGGASSSSSSAAAARAPPPALADLRTVARLGSGAFGKVALVAGPDGRRFALKTLQKAALVAGGLVEHAKRERGAMACCGDSPFLVHLEAAYKDADSIHLLLEAVMGGELFGHLQARAADLAGDGSAALPEAEARFYAGCVVLGLETLHARDLAWRDLKPENLLIGNDGYLKLADFGFTRRLPPGEVAMTLCGTPEYLAPELVTQAGHGKEVDWWALGVLIFELAAGRPPFDGGPSGDRVSMFRAIRSGKYATPPHFSAELKDLVKRLLATSPAARLGSGRDGAAAVKAHPWFARLDWAALADRALPAPHVPCVASPDDTSYFAAEEDEEGEGDGEGEGGRERYVSTGAFEDF